MTKRWDWYWGFFATMVLIALAGLAELNVAIVLVGVAGLVFLYWMRWYLRSRSRD
jgi:Flp pilus assembly protein TadB